MRNLDVAVLDLLDGDLVNFALLGEFDFADGITHLWAAPEGTAVSWAGETWVGVGDIGQVDKIAEGQQLADSRTTLSLRLDSDHFDISDVTDSRGRAARIILLAMSDEGEPLGEISFRMTMGPAKIAAAVEQDEQGRRVVHDVIALELLSETATLGNSHFVRATYEAGLRIDPDDHGLEFVSDPDVGNVGLFTGVQPGTPVPPRGPRTGPGVVIP